MATRSESDIEQSTEKLLQDLRDVVQDGEELLRAGAEDLSERGAAAREKLNARSKPPAKPSDDCRSGPWPGRARLIA